MDLNTSIVDAKKAIHCFFNNDFEQAKKILEPWADSSMYHSLGTSVFAFMEAVLTFEQVLIIYLCCNYLFLLHCCYIVIFFCCFFLLMCVSLYRESLSVSYAPLLLTMINVVETRGEGVGSFETVHEPVL